MFTRIINSTASLILSSLVGFATCLEEGCNYINIPLTPFTSLPDGGKAIGIGSLSAYSVWPFFYS